MQEKDYAATNHSKNNHHKISNPTTDIVFENPIFLTKQIITYLGNKRSLLNFISKGIKKAKNDLCKDKISFFDVFSGSGIVSRYAKQHSNFIIANDLELYSKIINECYLTNSSPDLMQELIFYHSKLTQDFSMHTKSGFITKLYAPNNDECIKSGERVFYTKENALYIDTMRFLIDKNIPRNLQAFFIAPLLYEASVKSNTAGVFKGFYKNRQNIGEFGGEGKNSLNRITAKFNLELPVFSKFNCEFKVYQQDSNSLAKSVGNIDIAYLDPPYNQHPYGSNYFMLNLIASNKAPKEISKVAGIPKSWNRSQYNKKSYAKDALFELVNDLRAKFVLISFNSEGFINENEFKENLAKFGKFEILQERYNTFRGSRNLKNRNIHLNEYLYILKKD